MGDEIDISPESYFSKSSKKMDNVIDFLSKIKPFDKDEIYKIRNKHPFQDLIRCLKEQLGNDHHNDLKDFLKGGWTGKEGQELEKFYDLEKYFEKLDNFYRYGFCFDDDDLLFEKYLFVYVRNGYRWHIIDKFKFEYYEDEADYLKYINLDDFYKSDKELSLLERWKRKIVFRRKSFKDKITLLLPFVYHNFDMFHNLSKIENIHPAILFSCLDSKGYEHYLYEQVFHNYFEDDIPYEDELYKKYQLYIDPGVNVAP